MSHALHTENIPWSKFGHAVNKNLYKKCMCKEVSYGTHFGTLSFFQSFNQHRIQKYNLEITLLPWHIASWSLVLHVQYLLRIPSLQTSACITSLIESPFLFLFLQAKVLYIYRVQVQEFKFDRSSQLRFSKLQKYLVTVMGCLYTSILMPIEVCF